MSARDDRYNRSEKGRARWRRYEQRRYQERKALGLCVWGGCEAPLWNNTYCYLHARCAVDRAATSWIRNGRW